MNRNTVRLLIFACCTAIFSACTQTANVSYETLKANFQNPTKDFRPAPLWVWNTEIKPENVEHSLHELKDKGFGGVFVHPRPGLITEFLSEQWMDGYRKTIDVAKQLDMNVWIYDENSYPSGFAGGLVPEQMPESYNQGGGLTADRLRQLPDDISKYDVIVLAEGDSTKDITTQVADYKGVDGDYYLYRRTYWGKSDWYANQSYVDLLSKGVTEKFIEIALDVYTSRFKKEMGHTLKGIFSDEPEIPAPGRGIRWTPDLFERFEKTFGYSLKEVLPLTHEPIGEYQKVRHDYYEMLHELFVERWAKPMYEYCEKQGVDWTGHYWEHNWPNVNGVVDNMAMAAYQQIPGIDMLFRSFNEESPTAQFGNVRSVKEVSSIANQLGRSRVLSETYGGAGWGITFKEMKRLADWQFVLGVNLVNHHLSPLSISGVRKQDYPPMFSEVAPWWESYRPMNDYNARASYLLSQGEQINDIVVLEPTTSIWLHNRTCAGVPAISMEIGKEFQALVTAMTKAMVEYDLGCEDVIDDWGSVKKGKFIIGNRAYSSVVIAPKTLNLEQKTFDLLQEFARQGGKIYASGAPTYLEGARNPEVEAFFQSAHITPLPADPKEAASQLEASRVIRFTTNESGNLYHYRRQLSTDTHILMVANVSLDSPNRGAFEIKGKQVYCFDAMTGKVWDYPVQAMGDNVKVEFELEPAGSRFFYISDRKEADEPLFQTQYATYREIQADTHIKRIKDNVLNVCYLDLTCGDSTYKDIYFMEANYKPYQHAGYTKNPWHHAIQYKRTIVDHQPERNDGFKAVYQFEMDPSVTDHNSFRIVLEMGHLYTVQVNGTVMKPSGEYLFEPNQMVYDVSNCLQTGNNTVEVLLGTYHPLAEIYSMFVLGNFDLKANTKGEWVITKAAEYKELKPWKEMGAPFYPWAYSYGKQFNKEKGKRYLVKADTWKGITAQVVVNGRKAGLIIGEPWTIEITDYLQEGSNQVELQVIGSLDNLIGPHHVGSQAVVGPFNWSGVKHVMKAQDYHFVEYGLTGDFAILEEE